MSRIELQAAPQEFYSAQDVDRLFSALEKRIQQREVMRKEQAADFLGISERTLDKMCQIGNLPFHKLEGMGGKFFLRSELIDFIKRH